MDLLSKISALKRRSDFNFDADLFVGLLASLIGKQHAIVTVNRAVYLDFAEGMISRVIFV